MQSPYFEYTKTSCVHRFVMYRADQEAVEAYFDARRNIFASLEEGAPCLTIVDLTQSGLPLTELTVMRSIQTMKQFRIKHPHRMLIISDDSAGVHLARVKVKMNPFLHIKYITPEEEEAHMKWLLTGLST